MVRGLGAARRGNIEQLDAEIARPAPDSARQRPHLHAVGARRPHRQRSDGRFAILDYKTGQPPTGNRSASGLSPQLTLEAAILREGGFEDIPAGASVAELVYVRLSGTIRPASSESLELKIRATTTLQPPTMPPIWRAQLEALIREFEDAATPYTRSSLPMWTTRYGTYDHLARVQEWSLTGGADEDEAWRMSAARTFPTPSRAKRQTRASDPAASAWVSANAGSGKTHVLASA